MSWWLSSRALTGARICAVLTTVLWVMLAHTGAASATTPGTITTIAGTYAPTGAADSIGQSPLAVAPEADGGFVIVDSYNDLIRRVSPSGQEITLAGNAFGVPLADGVPGTSAAIDDPTAVAVDSRGDVIFSELAAGQIWLIAAADCTTGCPFGLSQMEQGDVYELNPGTRSAADGLGVDSRGDVLVADYSYDRLLLIAAGNCSSSCPYGLGQMNIGQIYTLAGIGTPGYSGDAAPGSGAKLDHPDGVGIAPDGDAIIADYGNDRLRLLAASSCETDCPYGLSSTQAGDIYTIAGDGQNSTGQTGPALGVGVTPHGDPALDSRGDVLIPDMGGRIELLAATDCSADCPFGQSPLTAGNLTILAGPGTGGPLGDGGPAGSAHLNATSGAAIDAGGDLLVADSGDNRVRLIAAANCSSACPDGLGATVTGNIYTVAGDGLPSYSGDGGSALNAQFSSDSASGPSSFIYDAQGNLLVADEFNDRVRMVAAASCVMDCAYGLPSTVAGDVYTIVGNGTFGSAGDGGPGGAAELEDPDGLVLDPDGDLIVSEATGSRVRLLAASSCQSGCPYGLPTMTGDDLYTIAGTGTAGDSGDGGPAAQARLNNPSALAIDRGGDVLVADTANGLVRLIAAADCAASCPYGLSATTAGDIYTIAGGGTGSQVTGGPATGTGLNQIDGLTTDAVGDVLISTTFGDKVFLIAAGDCTAGCPFGLASTQTDGLYAIAGTGSPGFSGDGGPATAARLDLPTGIGDDADGDLLIADSSNDRVRLVAAVNCSEACPYGLTSMTTGDIYTVAGGSGPGSGDGGPATSADIGQPRGVATAPDGDLVVTDGGLFRLISGGPAPATTSTPPPTDTPPTDTSPADSSPVATSPTAPVPGESSGGSGAATPVVSSPPQDTPPATKSSAPLPKAPTTAQVTRTVLAALTISGRSSSQSAIRRADGYAATFRAPLAGRLVIDWYTTLHGRRVLVGAGAVNARRAGTLRLKVVLTAEGRRLLKYSTSVRLIEQGTFTETAGHHRVTARHTATLRSVRPI